MNVTLPSELKRFVERNVREGRYESVSHVVSSAVRLLQDRDRLLRAETNLMDSVLSTGPYADIDATLFLVLMQAVKDANEDLRMMMAEVKATTAAKQKLRDLIRKVGRDIVSNAGRHNTMQPLEFLPGGMGSERAYHRAQIPIPDPEAASGFKLVQTDLYVGTIDDVAMLVFIQETLKEKLDGMNEMSEMTSLRLQMMMDRRSKFISTLSNIMKKISATQDTLVQNLK